MGAGAGDDGGGRQSEESSNLTLKLKPAQAITSIDDARGRRWNKSFASFGAVCVGNIMLSLIVSVLIRSQQTCQCQHSSTSNNMLLGNDTSTSSFPTATSAHPTIGTQQTKEANKKDQFWSDFTMKDMKKYLNCHEFYEKTDQTIHDQDAWKRMRRTYVDIVGAEASTVGPPDLGYNGFSRPYYVNHNENGRGIYAKADIPQGSLVWHNIRSASFSDGMAFRKFVMTLSLELGCDVLQWSYVMEDAIYTDLDEGSFCNNGGSSKSNIDLDETASTQFITKAGIQLYSTRDIKQREELLCDYSSFTDRNWELFGL